MYLAALLSTSWLEGNRFFDVAFGTVTSAACLSLAIPILMWSLPGSRRRVFSESVDPRQLLQLAFGILCMSMAFADALCRYIPHRPLGLVHPSFFVTTVALVLLLGPRVVRIAMRDGFEPWRVSPAGLSAALVGLAVVPIAAVVNAFWF